MKKSVFVPLQLIICAGSFAAWAGNTPPPAPHASSAEALPVSDRPLSSDTVLEQGKALYNDGQYVAALDKFMKVLRRDPQQPEAREYLRLVVDQLRSKRRVPRSNISDRSFPEASMPAEVKGRPVVPAVTAKPSVPAPFIDEEVRQRVRQRQLLTFDLAAIPGVKISVDSKRAQVEINSDLLFADKTGGLKEEGIPLLDRVGAWLKTFGQQPVAIHCYPEELATADNASISLFLHRYAQLYGFFVDEKKMPAARFVGTDLGKSKDNLLDMPKMSESGTEVKKSSETSRILIVSLGGGSLEEEEATGSKQTRWLEFSILASHVAFSPEEGEWATLDIAALTKSGVKSWSFKIVPTSGSGTPVYSVAGTGNLLKRISWDGRDQKSGSFVSAGSYTCKLTATNSEEKTMNQEIVLKIQHETEAKAIQPAKTKTTPKETKKVAKKSKPAPAKAVAPASPELAARTALPESTLPQPVKTPVVAAAAEETDEALEGDETDDSAHAIWKQVIQFDANESDLKPTLKASLERIGKTLEVYPLQKVRIVGFAARSEANAATLANQRAEMIRHTLIAEYQVDAKRVIVEGGKVGSAGKVEISITN